ncbi:putative uncharacterized protein [Clostridium sp. CAG:273]|nr:putative uncharacterized protein [Clostridium sp. CAG:273]
MGNIILFIITLTIISLTLYFIYKSTEKSNSLVEKISYIVLAIVDSAILIIYYFDRFNVPTELGWNINVNTQNWLNFIATYTTGIISAGIAALVSVFVTIYQIKKNNEENDRGFSESWSYYIVAERLIAYKYGKISEVRVQNIENNLETIIKEFESMKNELLFILSENAEQEN